MWGTLVNAVGIIAGSLLGLILKKGIPTRVNDAVIKAEGLAIAVIALNGVLGAMITVDTATGRISASGGLLLSVSLVIGCAIGEFLKIDDHLNRFGLFVEHKIKSDGFAKGFVTASLIFSVGAMSVIGPINEVLSGDSSILYIKTVLDGTTSIVLASALGSGVLFSFVVVLAVQSVPALLAHQLSPFISDALLDQFCMVGYAIIICIAINFLLDAKIKVANLLPSLIVPIVYYFITI